MKIIINIKNFVFFLLLLLCGCTENIHFLKGTYWYSELFFTETITFDDSLHFQYFFASDGEESGYSNKGIYLINNNILQLNFDVRQYEKPFIFNMIDSSNTVSDSILLDINIIDTYTKKSIPFSVITILDTLYNIISIDTSDYSGHILKRLKKSSQVYLIKSSFTRFASNDYYYTSSIKLNTKLNYKINFNTIQRDSRNSLDGKTLDFKITNMSKSSFEVENITLNKKRKKFILGKPYK